MFVAVLCGGKGTRLHPITNDEIPKCMAPVVGRPFIDWKLDNLAEQGFDDILLLAGHKWDVLSEYLGDRARIVVDPGLGRGLGLWNALPDLPDAFWLTYGDTLLSFDPQEALKDAKRDGVMTVTPEGVDYGAMFVPRWPWESWLPFHRNLARLDLGRHVVSEPWHEINTPDSLAECEQWLKSRP